MSFVCESRTECSKVLSGEDPKQRLLVVGTDKIFASCDKLINLQSRSLLIA